MAIDFDGKDDQLSLPTHGFDNFTKGITVFAMHFVDQTPAQCFTLMYFSNGDETDDLSLLNFEGRPTFEVLDSFKKSPGSAAAGAWSLWAAVLNPADGKVSIRVNSVAIASGTVKVPTKVVRKVKLIGNDDYSSFCTPYDGKIAEIAVFNRALSTTELVSIEQHLSTKW